MNLYIDTSTNRITLAKFDNDDCQVLLYEANNDITVNIYGYLSKLLNSDEFDKISCIYVIVGPGSFTALRIGVTIAKTIAMEKKCKLVPINMLELQYTLYQQKIALDARGKKYFTYDGHTYEILPEENITDEYLVDNNVLFEDVYKSKVLYKFKEVNYLEVKVEYLKDVI